MPSDGRWRYNYKVYRRHFPFRYIEVGPEKGEKNKTRLGLSFEQRNRFFFGRLNGYGSVTARLGSARLGT